VRDCVAAYRTVAMPAHVLSGVSLRRRDEKRTAWTSPRKHDQEIPCGMQHVLTVGNRRAPNPLGDIF